MWFGSSSVTSRELRCRFPFQAYMGMHEFAGIGLCRQQRQLSTQDCRCCDDGQPLSVAARLALGPAAQPGQVLVDEIQSLAVADTADDEVGQSAGEVQIAGAVFGEGDALRALHD